jgi:hypothetical protein
MAKRILLENITPNDVTGILESLRRAGIKVAGGGCIEPDAFVLAEEPDVPRVLEFLKLNSIRAQAG